MKDRVKLVVLSLLGMGETRQNDPYLPDTFNSVSITFNPYLQFLQIKKTPNYNSN